MSKHSNVVVICGSRNADVIDDELYRFMFDRVAQLPEGTIIRHGGARGVDRLAEEVADDLSFRTDPVEANWEAYGNAAGPIRNTRMLEKEPKPYLVIAFWDEKSRGTKDMIQQAKKKGVDVEVHALSHGSVNVRI